MKISHIKFDNEKWIIQSNQEHQRNVSLLCARFSSEFHSELWGKAIGLFHDLGKESGAFQCYISGKSGYKPELIGAKRTPHAYVGALALKEILPQGYPVHSYCVIGHHTGLPDCGSFDSSMCQVIPPDIKVENCLDFQLSLPYEFEKTELHMWIRMLFSCLVDADFLDTELFMDKKQALLRQKKSGIRELLPLFNTYLEKLTLRSAETLVNKIRARVQKECIEASSIKPGFFSLTVPTGGGKTLASLAWAMNHAVVHEKKRIIIAIPYTSIIVQTAQILRSIFGEENVLEHHSAINKEEYGNFSLDERLKLMTENWDAPIVVTTNVQLFESLFSNRPSKCRKLHNICNSIVILDEVQTLPLEYLHPIVDSLKCLQRLFGVSILFTTASQPAINGEIRYGKKGNDYFEGIKDIHEIITDPSALSILLRRAYIHIDTENSNYDQVADRMMKHKRVLCIVNTRTDAKEIYMRIPEEETAYHLSRMMCPAHICETIENIKIALKSEKETIRVVSTQLIEAGVDIDFPVVFRQEAGLDSVIQASGRCNREGKLKKGDTYVFRFEKPLPPGNISFAASAMDMLDKNSDWFEPEIMKTYFRFLYRKIETFDKARINDLLCKGLDFYFDTAADNFCLIDDKGVSIIVNYRNSSDLIKQLKTKGPSYSLKKHLSQYSVNIREKDFESLKSNLLLEEVIEGVYWLPDREQYSPKVGVVIENHWLEELLIK